MKYIKADRLEVLLKRIPEDSGAGFHIELILHKSAGELKDALPKFPYIKKFNLTMKDPGFYVDFDIDERADVEEFFKKLSQWNPNYISLKNVTAYTAKKDLVTPKEVEEGFAKLREEMGWKKKEESSDIQWTKQASEPGEVDYDFSSTQVTFPKETSDKILKWIDDNFLEDILYIDDDIQGKEDYPHITLKYGIHSEKSDESFDVLKDAKPFKIKFGKISLFENDL